MSAQKLQDAPKAHRATIGAIGHVPQARFSLPTSAGDFPSRVSPSRGSQRGPTVVGFATIDDNEDDENEEEGEELPKDPKLKCLYLREKTKRIKADLQVVKEKSRTAKEAEFQKFAEELRDNTNEDALKKARQTIANLKQDESDIWKNVALIQQRENLFQILTQAWSTWREAAQYQKLMFRSKRLADTLERERDLVIQLHTERWLRFMIGLLEVQKERNQYAIQKDPFLESIHFRKTVCQAASQVSHAQPANPHSFLSEHFAAVSDRKMKSKRKDNSKIGQEFEKLSFPETLGPFALLETQQLGRDIQIDSEKPDGQRTWFIDRDAAIWSSSEDLKRLSGRIETWPIRGTLGPAQSLNTFADDQIQYMKAPQQADSFTWSAPYPIDFAKGSEELVAAVANNGAPEVAFILRGGFVFLNLSNKVCGLCTIAPAIPDSGMQFGEPLPWKPEWTAVLAQRFSRITIQALKDKGAHYYCWIRPQEPELESLDIGGWKFNYGGFCYLFHEDIVVRVGTALVDDCKPEDLRDCIFPLEQVLPTINAQQTFEFVGNMWEMFSSKLNTPYFALTSAIEDLLDKGAVSKKKYDVLMEAIEKISSGRGAEVERNQNAGEKGEKGETDVLSPWLQSVGCIMEDNVTKEEMVQAEDDLQNIQIALQAQTAIEEEKLNEMDFDCLATDPQKILPLIGAIFQCNSMQLTRQFDIDVKILERFLSAIKLQYRDTPYHNWNHAWDVLQFCFMLCNVQKLAKDQNTLSSFNVLVLFTCAIAHDVGHPGVSNQYLSRTGSSLAITYNDQSILENMHSATLFRTLEHGVCEDTESNQDFLRGLSVEQYMLFREKAIRAILATDMSQHFSFVQRLHVATQSSGGAKKRGKQKDTDQQGY